MIRSFIFDIGNVLIPFDFNRTIKRIESQCRISLDGVPPQMKPITEAYESGQIGRAQFLEQTIALLQFQGTEAEMVAAWEDIFTENHAMTRFVQQLHGRYPLYLLSNTSDIHVDYFIAKYPVFQYFSDAVYSHIAGSIKPGRAIFELAIRQFGVEPSEAVYIDDLPANVATAKELGFQAFQYDFNRHNCLLDFVTTLGVDGIAE